MKTRRVQLSALAAVAISAGACVGEVEGPGLAAAGAPDAGPGGQPAVAPGSTVTAAQAKALFEDGVKPLLQGRCAACHSNPPAAPAPRLWNAVTYEEIAASANLTGAFNPNRAQLLTKGPHSTVTTWWSPAETAQLADWLNAEFAVRNAGQSPQPATGTTPPPSDAMKEFVGCMTLANWQAAGMTACANWNTNQGNYTCSDCHSGAQYGVAMCQNEAIMFQQNTTQFGVQTFFKVDIQNDGSEKAATSFAKFERAGNGTTLHPTFNYQLNSQCLQAAQKFYELTLAAKAAGACGPAQYNPQMPACVQ